MCFLLDVVGLFLLSGKEVPQDYLRKSWDAILKSKGFKTEDVHSIEFFIYRFELAGSRNLEASIPNWAHPPGDYGSERRSSPNRNKGLIGHHYHDL